MLRSGPPGSKFEAQQIQCLCKYVSWDLPVVIYSNCVVIHTETSQDALSAMLLCTEYSGACQFRLCYGPFASALHFLSLSRPHRSIPKHGRKQCQEARRLAYAMNVQGLACSGSMVAHLGAGLKFLSLSSPNMAPGSGMNWKLAVTCPVLRKMRCTFFSCP